jgi:hypothetical protein
MSAKFMVMPGAKEFILKQGGSIFIRPQPRLASSGCATPKIIPFPAVFLGKPPPEEEYQLSEINEVNVYLHPLFSSESAERVFRVDMEMTLFGERLAVGSFQGDCDSCDSCGNCSSC